MFTRENVFEKRKEFENACKGKIHNSMLKEIGSAKTEAEFLQVIYSHFYWVYGNVSKFGLKYDYVGYFYEGFARVNKGKKWGFIDTKFNKICELKYDYAGYFREGFAIVKKDKKWGKLYPDGREEFEN